MLRRRCGGFCRRIIYLCCWFWHLFRSFHRGAVVEVHLLVSMLTNTQCETRLIVQRTGASILYRNVRMAAFCQMFHNCDHWTLGSIQTNSDCTDSFTPKDAASSVSTCCHILFSEREAPR